MANEARITQAGAFAGIAGTAARVTQAGAFVSIAAGSGEARVTQAGAFVSVGNWRFLLTAVASDKDTVVVTWENLESSTPSAVALWRAVELGTDDAELADGFSEDDTYTDTDAPTGEDTYYYLVVTHLGDDIESSPVLVEVPGSMTAPVGRVQVLSDTEATLGTNSVAAAITVRYQTRPATASVWSSGLVDSGDQTGADRFTRPVTGLTASTDYQTRMRFLDSVDEPSRWSTVLEWTTEAPAAPEPTTTDPNLLAGFTAPKFGQPVSGATVSLAWTIDSALLSGSNLLIEISANYGSSWSTLMTVASATTTSSFDSTPFTDGTFLLRLSDTGNDLVLQTVTRIDNSTGNTYFINSDVTYWDLIDPDQWTNLWNAPDLWSAATFGGGTHVSVPGDLSIAAIGPSGMNVMSPLTIPKGKQAEVTCRVRIASDGSGIIGWRWLQAELRFAGIAIEALGVGTEHKSGVAFGLQTSTVWPVGDCDENKGIGIQGLGSGKLALNSYSPTGDGNLNAEDSFGSDPFSVWCHSYHCPRGWAWYNLHLLLTRVDSDTIRLRATGGGLAPIDDDNYWLFDEEITGFPENCGYIGLASQHFANFGNDQGWAEFQYMGVTLTEESTGCPDDELIIPETEEFPSPGKPCSLLLTVFEEDRLTPAWEVATDPDHEFPYLMDPEQYGEQYGEQEADFSEGRASIGQVAVMVVDVPQTSGDQDTGFVTAKLADGTGVTAIKHRRMRLIRYISPEQGWIVIADGPGGEPELVDSYSAFRVQIRDTREFERSISAFNSNDRLITTMAYPSGATDTDYQVYVDVDPPALATFDIAGAIGVVRQQAVASPAGEDFLNANLLYVDVSDSLVTWNGPLSSGNVGNVEHYVHDELLRIYASQSTALGGGGRRHTWPNVVIEWKYLATEGVDDWTTITPVAHHTAEQLTVARSLIGDIGYFPGFLPGTHHGQTVITKEEVPILWGFYLPSAEDASVLPDEGETIRFRVRYKGPVSSFWPFHYQGPAGTLAQNLYDGIYSRLDFEGNTQPTGVRYDEDALDAMTDTVRLRLTEPIDDIRKWLEDNIYKPLGYAPAYDLDGRVSPLHQALPEDRTDLITIDNDNAAPRPGWAHGTQVINIVRVKYKRDYFLSTGSDPFDSDYSRDGLATVDVEHEFRDATGSIDRFDEQIWEVETEAFMAYGDADGMPANTSEDEIGYQAALARSAILLPRYAYGTPTVVIPALREDTFSLRAGNWVIADLSWMPNYLTLQRGLERYCQVLAAADLNCAWREFTLELGEVDGVPAFANQSGSGGGGGASTFSVQALTWSGSGPGGAVAVAVNDNITPDSGSGSGGAAVIGEFSKSGAGSGGSAAVATSARYFAISFSRSSDSNVAATATGGGGGGGGEGAPLGSEALGSFTLGG